MSRLSINPLSGDVGLSNLMTKQIGLRAFPNR